jgi:hypothetical protein
MNFRQSILSKIKTLVAPANADEFKTKKSSSVKDADLKAYLVACLKEVEIRMGRITGLSVKHMGKAHASEKYKNGYYIHVQNFKSLKVAKGSGDDKFFRFSFRAVQLREQTHKIYLEVLVWHPSHGNATELRHAFFVDADTGRDDFLQFLTTAINMRTSTINMFG